MRWATRIYPNDLHNAEDIIYYKGNLEGIKKKLHNDLGDTSTPQEVVIYPVNDDDEQVEMIRTYQWVPACKGCLV